MKKSVIWIILGVIIVALVVYFAFMNRGNDSANETENMSQTSNTTETKTDDSSAPKSLKDLMSTTSSVKCEFDATTDSNNSSGAVHAANGKARVDFSNATNGQTTSGHMIMDQNMAYTWIDGQAKGFKISTTAATTTPNETDNKQLDPNKKMDYRCSNWSEDASMFNLPKDIEFTDLSAMMPPAQGEIQGNISPTMKANNTAQCAACDQVPEASRAQCRTAMGCK